MRTEILHANCQIPEIRTNTLQRTDLFACLKDAPISSLVLIQGGAGSGKTTFAASYLKEQHQRSAWLTLDATCDQLYQFWAHFATACKSLLLNAALEQEFYETMRKDQVKKAIISLLNDLQQGSGGMLVLDDLQQLHHPEVLKSLHYFLVHRPASMRILLLSRTMPELYLADFVMRNELVWIDESQLRFNESQQRAFLRNICGLSCSQTAMDHLCEMAQGWIGGLALLASACQGKTDQEILHQQFSTAMIHDYMRQEIFQPLPEEFRHILILTSIMEYVTEELLVELFQDTALIQQFQWMLKQNLLITWIDESRKVYQYHDILRQFLLTLFERLPKQEQCNHERKVAKLFLSHQDETNAIQHLLHAHAYEIAMELILKQQKSGIILSYMDQIPLAQICKNPDFAYQYFFYHYVNEDNDTCEAIYQEIASHLQDTTSFQVFQFANKFIHADFYDASIEIQSMETILAQPLGLDTKSFLLIKDAFFLYVQNRYEEAIAYLKACKKIYQKTKNPYTGFILFLTMTQIYEETGAYERALQIYEQERYLMQEVHGMASSFYLGIAGVYLKQLRLDECYKAITACKENLIQETGTYLTSIEKGCFHTETLYYLLCHDPKGLSNLKQLLYEAEQEEMLHLATFLLLYHHSIKPLTDKLSFFMKSYQTATPPISYDAHALYISLLMEQGDTQLAFQVLQEQLQRARRTSHFYGIVLGDLLKLCYFYETTPHACIQATREAIAYAIENQIKLPFWLLKKKLQARYFDMMQPLQQEMEHQEWQFFKQQIEIQEERLTRRELEVLKEITAGKRNQQIADTLCISLATVKTHILNIYGKLQIDNRTAAVNWYRDHIG